MMTDTAIRLEGISHRYGSKILFKKLNLSLKANKITVIVGKSGNGKSTLLEIINGLVVPDSGQVYISGAPLVYQHIHKTRLRIGYAVQQVGLFPHLNISQNISLPGKLAGWTKVRIEKRMAMLMTMMGLSSSYLTRYPFQLSGGEQQRIGLCRAILLNPSVMLLDEPFSSLDVHTKTTIHEHLLTLQQQEPRCIVLVTHDLNEAGKLGDDCLCVENTSVESVDL